MDSKSSMASKERVAQENERAGTAKLVGLAASKYAGNPPPRPKIPQTLGLFVKEDPNLEIRFERVARNCRKNSIPAPANDSLTSVSSSAGSSTPSFGSLRGRSSHTSDLGTNQPALKPRISFESQFNPYLAPVPSQDARQSFAPLATRGGFTGSGRGRGRGRAKPSATDALIEAQNRRAMETHRPGSNEYKVPIRSVYPPPRSRANGEVLTELQNQPPSERCDNQKNRADASLTKPGPSSSSKGPSSCVLPPDLSNTTENVRMSKAISRPFDAKLVELGIKKSHGSTPASAVPIGIVDGSKTAGDTAHLRESKAVTEQIKHAIVQWPPAESRSRPSTDMRRVDLTNIPPNCGLRDIANMLWGGGIERIDFEVKDSKASAVFISAKDCRTYYEDTASRIDYKGQEVSVAVVNKVEPLGEAAKRRINAGCTRCIKAAKVPGDLDHLPGVLNRMGLRTGFLDRFFTKDSPGAAERDCFWHFANIEAAVQFKQHLEKNAKFQGIRITFESDPCSAHRGVHTGNE